MPDFTISDLVGAWIHAAPGRYKPSLTDLAASSNTAATARGIFLGDDGSDPGASGAEIYSDPKNLPTAIASILSRVQEQAHFHPADASPEELVTRFQAYVYAIDHAPFIHLNRVENSKQSFRSEDYNVLIDQIVKLYTDVPAQYVGTIEKAVTDMGKSVFGQEHSKECTYNFILSIIDVSQVSHGNPPKLMIYYTFIHMRKNKDGKSEVPEQNYTVIKTDYVVLTQFIQSVASSLARLPKKSVDDWIKANNSPESPDAKLCFTRRRPEGR